MAVARYPEELKAQARELRAAGMSVSRIAFELDVKAPSVVQRWVADIPPPGWTRRPNAKDETRAQAREMRLAGASLKEIARRLTVATSSVSVWVRDLPVPEGLRQRAAHAYRMNNDRWLRERDRREADRQKVKGAAKAAVGTVSDRELMLLGAVLYWAEGSKDKPYDRREHIAFINSDADVIRLFLRWLDLMNAPEEDRRYRLSIHETADIEAAHEFWAAVVGVPRDRFDAPTLKRHQPATRRLNIGANYHGCLIVKVCKSRVLYQRMDGLFAGIVEGSAASSFDGHNDA